MSAGCATWTSSRPVSGLGSRVGQGLSPASPRAQALAKVHERGLCHLDVKPANVWVAGGGGAPRVCLLDLAFAHEFAPGGHRAHCTGGPAWQACLLSSKVTRIVECQRHKESHGLVHRALQAYAGAVLCMSRMEGRMAS